jgi:hypothetical protein
MKKPSNKVIAVYFFWVLIHLTLLVLAEPSAISERYGVTSRMRFFPFEFDGHSENLYSTKSFQIDKVYDLTEFTFYTIVPILIYYIITLFNSPKE